MYRGPSTERALSFFVLSFHYGLAAPFHAGLSTSILDMVIPAAEVCSHGLLVKGSTFSPCSAEAGHDSKHSCCIPLTIWIPLRHHYMWISPSAQDGLQTGIGQSSSGYVGSLPSPFPFSRGLFFLFNLLVSICCGAACWFIWGGGPNFLVCQEPGRPLQAVPAQR